MKIRAKAASHRENFRDFSRAVAQVVKSWLAFLPASLNPLASPSHPASLPVVIPGLKRSESAGFSLVASCFSDRGDRGGLFRVGSDGIEQLDDIHTTGLSANENEFVRLLRCKNEAEDCTVRIYAIGASIRNHRLSGLQDGHDVLRLGDGYAAISASTNAIVWFDGSGTVTRRIVFPGDRDAWHVNSLLFIEGKLLASAFGRFIHHRQWDSDARIGEGIVFEVETGADVLTGLTCPHHPRKSGRTWVVCNSGERELVEIDTATGVFVRRLPLSGWTRGLAVTDALFFVGITPPRHSTGAVMPARIAIVSREEWVEVDSIDLPVSEIYDLLFVRSSLLGLLTLS